MRSSDSFLQEATNPLYAQAPAIRSGGEAAGQVPAGSVTLPEALGLDTSSRGDPSHFSSSGTAPSDIFYLPARPMRPSRQAAVCEAGPGLE